MKRLLVFSFFQLLLCGESFADNSLKVVTTLSSYADIAKAIGGNLVDVDYLVSPRFDPHFIEPKPSDVLKVKRSDLFVHSGLDLEAWREPLIDATGRGDIRAGGERQLDLSSRIRLLEVPTRPLSRVEGDIHVYGNPHYWLDPRNGVIIAEDIANKLIELDPANEASYQANLERFRSRLEGKIGEWQADFAPYKGRPIVGYHNGWAYLMHFSGLKMTMFLEPKPGIPPTPKHIECVIDYIHTAKVPAIVRSSHNSSDAAESIAEMTATKIVLLSQGVGDLEQSRDYISMFDYNISTLLDALNRDSSE